MTTNDERRRLTEPLESVTTFFGALMIIAALVGVAFLVFGAALLTFARIVKAGAAMDAEIQATI